MKDIVVASRNAGKVAELSALLTGLSIRLIGLDHVGVTEAIPETGATFVANAIEKAEFVCRKTGIATLADDSGLCVAALNGAPGVHSARYGGPGLTDDDRVRLLLAALTHVVGDARAARFVCVLALARPGASVVTAEGHIDGVIGHEPVGTEGFGYDPIFVLPDRGLTMAEVTPADKNAISHRAQAARAMRQSIASLMAVGDW